jgi:hypothetical protein
MALRINNARLAFPQLFEAKTVNGEGEPAFSAALLIDPKDPQIPAIKAAIEEVAREKWGAKAEENMKRIIASDKTALHNGDLKSECEGFQGMLYISARNKTRPLVIDKDKTPLNQVDGKPYAGCYVNASIELWAQDNKYGKRINASLRGIQFVKDGDAFAGGGTAKDDEFDDIAEGATAEADLW